MINYVMIPILIAIMCIAIKGSVKHFKGEGACCGGGSSVKPEKKKLQNKTVEKYILSVEGMHCQNCAYSVIRSINGIEGAVAKVSLGQKVVKVSCDRPVNPELLRNQVEKLGYCVRDMKKCS